MVQTRNKNVDSGLLCTRVRKVDICLVGTIVTTNRQGLVLQDRQKDRQRLVWYDCQKGKQGLALQQRQNGRQKFD